MKKQANEMSEARQNVEHTPTPWIRDEAGIWGPHEKGVNPLVTDAGDLGDEDAAYIVKAVNCHAKLIEGLKYIAAGMSDSNEKDKFTHARFYAADLLAKAEGK